MQTDKERYRRVRGVMLKVLATDDPTPMDRSVMHSMLDHLGFTITNEELYSHIKYLCDSTKAYMRVEEKHSRSFSIFILSITPKGLDLLDEFKDEGDPGVNVKDL